MAAKTFHGARAILQINGKLVGIFSSFSYGVQYDVADVYTLGRVSAQETVFTAAETVQCTGSGFRIVGAGPHTNKSAQLPYIQELLAHEYIDISIFDRQDATLSKPIATIKDCRPTGYSTTINARQLQEISVSFKGIMVNDESGENSELANSAVLP